MEKGSKFDKDDLENYKAENHGGKYRASLFFLTINTNKQFNIYLQSAHNAISEGFKEMIQRNLDGVTYKINKRQADIPDWIKDKRDAYLGDSRILSINVVFVTEVGSTYNRLHLHAWIDVRHTGNYHIDTGYIASNFYNFVNTRKEIAGYFVGRPFVHVAHVKVNSAENVMRYMNKSIRTNVKDRFTIRKKHKDRTMASYVGSENFDEQVKNRFDELF